MARNTSGLTRGTHGFMTSEEARKAAHAKSVETRKRNNARRKAMKEQFETLLKCRLSKNSSIKKKLKEMGIEDDELNNQMAIVYNMFLEASRGKGSSAVSAATYVRDTIGEKPTDKTLNVETDFESYIASLESNDEF